MKIGDSQIFAVNGTFFTIVCERSIIPIANDKVSFYLYKGTTKNLQLIKICDTYKDAFHTANDFNKNEGKYEAVEVLE